MKEKEQKELLFESISRIIEDARTKVYRSANAILLQMYWNIGKLIVEDEQKGEARATYGKAVLKNLAKQLTAKSGKGFEERNLNNMRAFYLAFPIWDALRTELSWTHYRITSRLENQDIRNSYVRHTIEENWNTRVLQRNIDSQYLNRILESKKDKNEAPDAKHFIKDPYIFEFLGVQPYHELTENKIETAIINHLQKFLIEMEKGFAFVGRQEHIITETSDFFIDLVFYNYYLKCFVLIDLKTEKLTPTAIVQMDMYVRMYNDMKRGEDDNPTIGLILCTEKDETIVRYSVLTENEKLFASKYRLFLPKEEDLKMLIENDRVKLEEEL